MSTLNYAYEELQLDFLHLCSLGDEKRVRDALLSGRVDVNYQHKTNGWTALHWSAHRDHFNVSLLLIEFGYPINVKDSSGRIPYEVCSSKSEKLRSVLQVCDTDDDEMVQGNVSRRSSDASSNSPGFVPNYVRNPPFPYAMKNSFDGFTPAAIPPTPDSPTYSYGRRDSFNKTRFLLVRTSVEKGKETYKRVTLPGGSDLERLKMIIEKACKRAVEMIFTLPENDLVESADQIHSFKDCQKIDVIFKDSEREETPSVAGDNMSSEDLSSPKDRVVEKDYSEEKEVEIPKEEEDHDEPEAEDLSRYVKEPSPPISLDIESNEHEEPKLVPLATRNSLDSDPGDFEKVDKEEASPAVAGIAAAIPIINAQVEEEHKNTPEPETPAFVAPSSKATVVEESKQVPEDRQSSDIGTWIHNNPDLVRNVATVAAVAGVAGLGYYVYVKKFK